jgi:hypothetical protein
MWIFNYAKKTNTDVPDLEGLSYLLHRVNRAMKIMYPDDVKLSDENLQPDENDENRRRFDRIPLAAHYGMSLLPACYCILWYRRREMMLNHTPHR